jgi:hypothetical protein
MLELEATAHPTTWVSKTDLYALHPDLTRQIDDLNEGDMLALSKAIGDAVASTHHMAMDVLLPLYLGLADTLPDEEDDDQDEPEPPLFTTVYRYPERTQPRFSHEGWHGNGESQASAFLTWLTFTRIAENEELEDALTGIAARLDDPAETALAAREQVEKALFSQPSPQPHLLDELARQSLRREVNWREIMDAYRE